MVDGMVAGWGSHMCVCPFRQLVRHVAEVAGQAARHYWNSERLVSKPSSSVCSLDTFVPQASRILGPYFVSQASRILGPKQIMYHEEGRQAVQLRPHQEGASRGKHARTVHFLPAHSPQLPHTPPLAIIRFVVVAATRSTYRT